MRQVRLIANILFYVTRSLAILILCVTVYAMSVNWFYKPGARNWVPMEVSPENHFTIFYPFTTSPFLLGDYTSEFLIVGLSILTFYSVFLWLLSSVFNTFRQQRLFTSRGVRHLSTFYWSNFILPMLFLVILLSLGTDLSDAVVISGLHLIIGIFAFFMSAIFRQGLLLQEEQDLTL